MGIILAVLASGYLYYHYYTEEEHKKHCDALVNEYNLKSLEANTEKINNPDSNYNEDVLAGIRDQMSQECNEYLHLR